MDDYDAIIIVGTGAGGARSPGTSRPPASGSCCSSAATGCRASRRTGSPRTCSWTTATSPRTRGTTRRASRSSRRSTTSSAARPSSTARRSHRLRAEDFGELRHHDGISPAWPISYDELEPYYTQGRAALPRCTDAAARTRPNRPRARRTRTRPSRTSRGSSSSPTSSPPPATTLPRALRDPARRAEHAVQHLRALRQLRRLPVSWCMPRPTPRCSACGPALEHENVTLLTNAKAIRLETNEAGTAVTERRRRARRRRRRRSPAIIVVVACGAANTAKLLLAVGERQAPERARQRLRPGRAQLHVPRQRWRCSRSRARRT